MSSSTTTRTTTISGPDIRVVWTRVFGEVNHICQVFGLLTNRVNDAELWRDISTLALYDTISALHLQFYVGRELVREYKYVIADTVLEGWGPDEEGAPTGPIPPGTTVRLVVSPNPACDLSIRDFWFQQMGWSTAEPLEMPDNPLY